MLKVNCWFKGHFKILLLHDTIESAPMNTKNYQYFTTILSTLDLNIR